MNELSITQLEKAVQDLTLIIDTRPTDVFVNGYLKGAINIVLNQNFNARAEYFSDSHDKIILVARKEDQAKLLGLLEEDLRKKVLAIQYQSLEIWQEHNLPIDMIINVDPYELKLDITHDDKAVVLDVRTKQQYDEEHIVGAVNMQMNDFRDHAKIGLIDDSSNLYLHCNGGTRSVLISSILKRNGYHNIRNIEGGFKAVLADGNIPTNSNNKKSQN